MQTLPDILADLADRPVGADAERVRIGDHSTAVVSPETLGRALAPWISLSGEFSRRGAYGLQAVRPGETEPRPVDVSKLAGIVQAAVVQESGHGHIAELSEFAYRGGDRATAYFVRVVKAFRAQLPASRSPRVARTSPAVKRASEERLLAAEKATAAFIVRAMSDPEDASFIPAGFSLPASELLGEVLASASELVSQAETFDPDRDGYPSWIDLAEDLGLPSRPRMPRRPVIIEALQAAGFERYRTGSGNRYRRVSN